VVVAEADSGAVDAVDLAAEAVVDAVDVEATIVTGVAIEAAVIKTA
jgi:hypothetical protein